MASWSSFAAAAPSLATSIRSALYQYGPGLAYLATVRPDGGPRLHPVSPAVVGSGLYCVMLDTPKRRDLERDGRYALHAFPGEDDDEACLQGFASQVTDPGEVLRIGRAIRADDHVTWWLYELNVESAMFAHRGPSSHPEVVSYQFWIDPDVARTLRGRARLVR